MLHLFQTDELHPPANESQPLGLKWGTGQRSQGMVTLEQQGWIHQINLPLVVSVCCCYYWFVVVVFVFCLQSVLVSCSFTCYTLLVSVPVILLCPLLRLSTRITNNHCVAYNLCVCIYLSCHSMSRMVKIKNKNKKPFPSLEPISFGCIMWQPVCLRWIVSTAWGLNVPAQPH